MGHNDSISDADRARLQTSLLEERVRLVGQVAELEGMHTELLKVLVQEVPDDEHDPDATTAFERAQVRSMALAAKGRLLNIDTALASISAAAFGRCETCGGPIGIERLTARPDATRCITCSDRPGRAPLRRKG